MRSPLFVLTIALISILLWGCPYKSEIPLGDAIEPVKKEIIGSWIPDNMKGKENPEYYSIEVRDSVHYDVAHFQFNEDEKGYTSKQYVGHSTRIGEKVFLNLQESGQLEFAIHRLDIWEDKLVLFEVTDNIDEQFKDSKAMQAFFEKNMRLSFFYNRDEVTLIRKEK